MNLYRTKQAKRTAPYHTDPLGGPGGGPKARSVSVPPGRKGSVEKGQFCI
jgi:hypothetical protein